VSNQYYRKGGDGELNLPSQPRKIECHHLPWLPLNRWFHRTLCTGYIGIAEIWKFEGRSGWGSKDALADEVLHNFNELLFGEVCNDNGVIPNGTTDRLLLAEV
jgi:hypothetical protein